MNDISKKYKKEVMIAETSIGYTLDTLGCKGIVYGSDQEKITGYEASQKGQEKYLCDLFKTVRSVEGEKGIGVFYWEPAWLPIPECNWASESGRIYMKDKVEAGNAMANQALFDANGNANLALVNLRNM